MKKRLYYLSILLIALLLVACSSKGTTEDKKEKDDVNKEIVDDKNDNDDSDNEPVVTDKIQEPTAEPTVEPEEEDYIEYEISEDMTTLTIKGKGVYDYDSERTKDITNYWKHIKTIVIEEGITEIYGNEGVSYYNPFFSNQYVSGVKTCYVEKVVLPNSLKIIGRNAFIGFGFLTDIEIPEGVEEIGLNAFCGCEELSMNNIKFPSSLRKIDGGAFYSSSGIFTTDTYSDVVYIPDGVEYIGSDVFLGRRLKELHIPKTTELSSEYSQQGIGISYNEISGFCSVEEVFYGGSLKDWVGQGQTEVPNLHCNQYK